MVGKGQHLCSLGIFLLHIITWRLVKHRKEGLMKLLLVPAGPETDRHYVPHCVEL